MDVTKAVKESKAGKVEYKVGVRHRRVAFGCSSMESDKLAKNFKAIMDSILKAKPQTSKGNTSRPSRSLRPWALA